MALRETRSTVVPRRLLAYSFTRARCERWEFAHVQHYIPCCVVGVDCASLDNYNSLQYCCAFKITATERRHVRRDAVTVYLRSRNGLLNKHTWAHGRTYMYLHDDAPSRVRKTRLTQEIA